MNSMQTLKAVLFDLDGTLIHSVDHIIDCWQHTVRTCLGREMTREEILPTLGRTLYDAFEEIAPGRSEELYEVYRAHQLTTHDTMVTLVPGTKETLSALKETGLLLGVVTAKRLRTAMEGLNLFDLAPYFDTIVTLEDFNQAQAVPRPLAGGRREASHRARRSDLRGRCARRHRSRARRRHENGLGNLGRGHVGQPE